MTALSSPPLDSLGSSAQSSPSRLTQGLSSHSSLNVEQDRESILTFVHFHYIISLCLQAPAEPPSSLPSSLEVAEPAPICKSGGPPHPFVAIGLST